MLALAPNGDFFASPSEDTVVARVDGALHRFAVTDALSIAVCPQSAAVLHADGHVSLVRDRLEPLWSIDPPAAKWACAVSPNGAHVFNGTHLVSRSRDGSVAIREPATRDFFGEFTYARFVDNAHLVLAYETTQPWSDGGSYGEPGRGVQVHRLDRDLSIVIDWWDTRRSSDSFEPMFASFSAPYVLAVVHASTPPELWITADSQLARGWGGRPEYSPQMRESFYFIIATYLAIAPGARWVAALTARDVTVFDWERDAKANLPVTNRAFAFHQRNLCWLSDDFTAVETCPLDDLPWRDAHAQ